MLEERQRLLTIGEAGTREEALALLHTHDWDLVLLDISLAGKSGLDLLAEIRVINRTLPVLVLSMHPESQYARRAFRTGASGYIMKTSPRAELLAAIEKVAGGGRYVSAAMAENLVGHLGSQTRGLEHEALSGREFEVMRLLGSGHTVMEVAGRLSLSDKTISTYRTRILEKMGFRNNAEIVRYVIEHRLLE